MLSARPLVYLWSFRLGPKLRLIFETLHHLALFCYFSLPSPQKTKPNKNITVAKNSLFFSDVFQLLSFMPLCVFCLCQDCPVGGGCGSRETAWTRGVFGDSLTTIPCGPSLHESPLGRLSLWGWLRFESWLHQCVALDVPS